MDRNEIEEVIELVRDSKNSLPPGWTRGVLVSAYYALEDALTKLDHSKSDSLDNHPVAGPSWEDLQKIEDLVRSLMLNVKSQRWQPGMVDAEILLSEITNLLMSAKGAENNDPGDECECEGCRAKVAEAARPEPASAGEEYAELEQLVRDGIKSMDERSDFGCLKFDSITDGPSDYEIRLKAWKIANDWLWEDVDDEFSATLDAAIKLYNFLSGRNEDVK